MAPVMRQDRRLFPYLGLLAPRETSTSSHFRPPLRITDIKKFLLPPQLKIA
jgi:hypothetical protein